MARLIRYGSITMTDNINHWWLSPNLTIADKLLKQKNWSKIFGQLLIIYIHSSQTIKDSKSIYHKLSNIHR